VQEQRHGKELLAYHKIRVPNFAIYSPGAAIKRPSRLNFRCLSNRPKTKRPTASRSILRRDDAAFEERIRFIHERMNQPLWPRNISRGGRSMSVSSATTAARLAVSRSDLQRHARRPAQVFHLQSQVGRCLSQAQGDSERLRRTVRQRIDQRIAKFAKPSIAPCASALRASTCA